MMNILNGGKHSDNNISIQEFMIMPIGNITFTERMRRGVEIYHTLKKVLKEKGYPLSLYEPLVHDAEYRGVRVEKDFTAFVSTSDLIIANRIDEKILPWKDKVFTRDPKKD